MKKRQQNSPYREIFYPQEENAPEKSARIIKNGGLIVFPTKGLYGIGADIKNEDSVQRIFKLKKRPLSKPILMLVRDIAEVEKYCTNIPDNIFPLMEKFWPGDITFVLEASIETPKSLTANTGKIGIRIPSHPFAKELLNFTENPITGTSANISGMIPPGKPQELDSHILNGSDIFINAGNLGEKKPSTIIDASQSSVEIIREGRVQIKDLKNFL